MGLKAIRSTAQTLSYYTRLQALTANNLANSDTEAFKADVMAGTASARPPGPSRSSKPT